MPVRRKVRTIPRRVARCRSCGGPLRWVELKRGIAVAFIVCDKCERAAVAPPIVVEFIEESEHVRQA
jgi:hypothetical protein